MSQQKECQECGGSGQVVVGEHRVTRDMAIDAGERQLEGSFHSYAYGPCESCGGSGQIQPEKSDA